MKLNLTKNVIPWDSNYAIYDLITDSTYVYVYAESNIDSKVHLLVVDTSGTIITDYDTNNFVWGGSYNSEHKLTICNGYLIGKFLGSVYNNYVFAYSFNGTNISYITSADLGSQFNVNAIGSDGSFIYLEKRKISGDDRVVQVYNISATTLDLQATFSAGPLGGSFSSNITVDNNNNFYFGDGYYYDYTYSLYCFNYNDTTKTISLAFSGSDSIINNTGIGGLQYKDGKLYAGLSNGMLNIYDVSLSSFNLINNFDINRDEGSVYQIFVEGDKIHVGGFPKAYTLSYTSATNEIMLVADPLPAYGDDITYVCSIGNKVWFALSFGLKQYELSGFSVKDGGQYFIESSKNVSGIVPGVDDHIGFMLKDGNYVYTFDYQSYQLDVIDITDVNNTVLLSAHTLEYKSILPNPFFKDGNYIYKSSYIDYYFNPKGVEIYQVTNVSALNRVAVISAGTVNYSIRGGDISGNYFYTVSAHFGYLTSAHYLATYDVTTPSAPSIVSTNLIPNSIGLGHIPRVVKVGSYIYVVLDSEGAAGTYPNNYNYGYPGGELIKVFDISTPSTPVYSKTLNFPFIRIRVIQEHNGYLYVYGQASSLYKYDVSDPLNPVLVKTVAVGSEYNYVESINFDDTNNLIYLADLNRGVVVLDMDTLDQVMMPRASFHNNTFGNVHRVGNKLITGHKFGIDVYNTTVKNYYKEEDLKEVSFISPMYSQNPLKVSNGRLYFSDYYNYIWCIDLSASPDKSVLVLSGDFVDDYVNDIEVSNDGNFLFTAPDGDKFKVFSISAIDNMQLIASAGPNKAYQFYKNGNYLYVACGNNGVYIYDISNPLSLTSAGRCPISGTAQQYSNIVVNDSTDLAYCIDGVFGDFVSNRKTICIYNVSSVSAPVFVSSVSYADQVTDIAYNDNAIVVTTWFQYFIYSATDKYLQSPIFSSDYFLNDFYCEYCAISGNLLFLAPEYNLLTVMDISNPSNPILVYDCPFERNYYIYTRPQFYDKYIIAATNLSFEIFEYDPVIEPPVPASFKAVPKLNFVQKTINFNFS